MRAAWYETQGPAREVLRVGDMPDPTPGPGEVRIRIAASGINPGDIKKRNNAFGYGMPYARVIPHSDGAGVVDALGDGVGTEWLGRHGSGATAPSRTVRSALPPTTRVVPLALGCRCPTTSRSSRGPASASRRLPRIVVFTSQDQSRADRLGAGRRRGGRGMRRPACPPRRGARPRHRPIRRG